jgi:branched-chain amino acid transport system substrate-binding protein
MLHVDIPTRSEFKALNDGFKAKYPDNDINQPRIFNTVAMLAKAIEAAGTTDPVKVAYALEGMEYDTIMGGKVWMRPSDHQAIQDVHISVHTNQGIVIDADNSGYGLVDEKTVPMAGKDSPTTCEMERPDA